MFRSTMITPRASATVSYSVAATCTNMVVDEPRVSSPVSCPNMREKPAIPPHSLVGLSSDSTASGATSSADGRRTDRSYDVCCAESVPLAPASASNVSRREDRVVGIVDPRWLEIPANMGVAGSATRRWGRPREAARA
jgi:hypothetical protein